MPAKIKLGQKPATFKEFPVKFQMPDGTQGEILVKFKYKTREEFGEMLNKFYEDSGKTRQPGEPLDFIETYQIAGIKSADHLSDAIDSWNLDEPVTADVISQLADEIPAAVVALSAAFHAACTEGRLGN